jgi:hypothetical protein
MFGTNSNANNANAAATMMFFLDFKAFVTSSFPRLISRPISYILVSSFVVSFMSSHFLFATTVGKTFTLLISYVTIITKKDLFLRVESARGLKAS